MRRREFIGEEEAVSPIIGTILMVAITVIMAAIISSWSAGIKAPQTPSSVGLDVSRLNQNNVTITITSIDPPQAVVNSLNASFPSGNSTNTVKRTLLGNGAPDSNGYTFSSPGPVTFIPDVKTNYANGSSSAPTTAAVGDSATIFINGYGQFMVISVTFADGSIKTIYSQKV